MPRWLTPAATEALAAATDLVGYGPYLDRAAVPGSAFTRPTTGSNSSARATPSNSLQTGAQVAVVSGGDPGVFAMAAAVFEALEGGDPAWRGLDDPRRAGHHRDACGSGPRGRASRRRFLRASRCPTI